MNVRILGLLLPLPAMAATWTVDPAGGADATTITAAVGLATDGDTVLIRAGTYTERVELRERSVHLLADGAVALWSPAAGLPPLSLIDAGGSVVGLQIGGGDTRTGELQGGCVQISGGAPVLEDLLIHDCAGRVGGGLWLHETAATLRRVSVVGASADADGDGQWGLGGCLYASGGQPVLDGVTLTDCAAVRGGGAMFAESSAEATALTVLRGSAERAGALSVQGGSLRLVDPTIEESTSARGAGAAWASQGAALTVQGGAFRRNVAGGTEPGAGGALRVSASTAALAGTVFEDNRADGGGTGGALRIDEGATLQGSALRLEGNRADFGGGLVVTAGASVELAGSQLLDNQTTGPGGGAYVQGTLTAVACRFVDNRAESDGGHVRVDGGTAELRASRLEGGWAANGGAVHLLGAARATLRHVTVVGASSPGGGALRTAPGAELVVRDSILAFPALGALLSAEPDGDVDVAWTTLWAPGGDRVSGGFADPAGAAENRAEDPLLLRWPDAAPDLHLAAESPCRDAAEPPALDPDGSPADRGAWGGPDAAWADDDADGDGWSIGAGDCDDDDPARHPGADDACDGVDQDCDGADDGCGDDDDSASDDDDDSADDDDSTDDDDDASAPPVPEVPTPDTRACGCRGGQAWPGLVWLVPLLGRRRRA